MVNIARDITWLIGRTPLLDLPRADHAMIVAILPDHGERQEDHGAHARAGATP